MINECFVNIHANIFVFSKSGNDPEQVISKSLLFNVLYVTGKMLF